MQTTIAHRFTFEGQDPLWHPSTWRIVTLSCGRKVKAGVMGADQPRRLAWLDEWEVGVIEKASLAAAQEAA